MTRYQAQRGRGWVNVDDSEDEEQRAAGRRTGPRAADTMVHTKDIAGARRRSHEPTAVRPELGLG